MSQSSRQAYRKVPPNQQRFPNRLTTARQCCHSQANLKRKQTSPNADRKPLPRLKKNSTHLRQLRNLRHRNRRKKNLLSRSLTLTTGSALPRATLRASDLRLTAEPCIVGITPSPQVLNANTPNGIFVAISTDMPRTATSPMCGFGMSRPEAALMKSISATHNNKTHFTRNASSLYGAFFVFKEVTNTMKKNLFKRGMAGLLSLVMCLTALVGIGTTTAYAVRRKSRGLPCFFSEKRRC